MARPVILLPTLSDAATVAASSEAGSLTAANVQTQALDEVWRTTTAATAWIEGEFSASQSIDMVALIGGNYTADAEFTLSLGATQAAVRTSPSYTATFSDPSSALGTPRETTVYHKTPAAEAATWWRIDIDDTANPDGYIETGRIYVGKAWQPSRGLATGRTTIGWTDASLLSESLGGQIFGDRRPLRKEIACEFRFLPQAETMTEAYELQRLLGVTEDLFFVLDPAATTHAVRECVYGLLVEPRPLEKLLGTGHWALRLRVRGLV